MTDMTAEQPACAEVQMSDRKDGGISVPTEVIANMDATCAEALRIAEKHVCKTVGSSYIPAPKAIGEYARKMLDALLSEREGGE